MVLAGCGNLDAYFESVLEVDDTFDSYGPYRIEAYVNAPRGVERLTLKVADADAPPDSIVFGDLGFTFEAGDEYRGRWVTELLGRPAGSGYTYYLLLRDQGDFLIRYPPGAPLVRLGFWVLDPIR